MTSKGPWRSRLGGNDVQRCATLAAIGIELRPSSSIEPRATSSPMKHDGDSSPLIPKNYPDDNKDLALLALRSPGSRFFIYFLVVCVLGDLVCVFVKFLFFFFFFFFLYLCLCLVAQKMWKRNGNLDFGWSFKKPTKFGNVLYLLILIWTLCYQTCREKFNFYWFLLFFFSF